MEDYKKYLFVPLLVFVNVKNVEFFLDDPNSILDEAACGFLTMIGMIILIVNCWLWASEYYELDVNFKIKKRSTEA